MRKMKEKANAATLFIAILPGAAWHDHAGSDAGASSFDEVKKSGRLKPAQDQDEF